MKDSISIKSPVDSSLIDRAEQECFQILLKQRLLYNERWYSAILFTKMTSILRLAGMLVSIFGVLVCVFYFVYPSSCPKWFFAELYLLFFAVTGLFFYFLPRIESRVITRLKNAGSKGCKRLARRLIAKAKKVVPYDAEYTIKGDLITYYRGKNDNWRQVWSGRLKGFAVVGKHATLLFRKSTSIHPALLIIYGNNDVIESVLKDLEITYKTLP